MKGYIFDTQNDRKRGEISSLVQKIFETPMEVLNNYRDRNLINAYHKHLHSMEYNYIIGIEKGGFFAYYLSELCRIPALIINPEFCYKSNPNVVLSSGNKIVNDYNEKMFLLTMKHELIDSSKTLKVKMNDYQRENSFIYDELVDVDTDTVKRSVESFIEKYKIKKGPTKNDKKPSKSSSSKKSSYQDDYWVPPRPEPQREQPVPQNDGGWYTGSAQDAPTQSYGTWYGNNEWTTAGNSTTVTGNS